jgi:hypothetical protein
MERIRKSCISSEKVNRSSGLEFEIPKTMNQNVIHKRLSLYAHKIQLKHEIKPDDWSKHYDFASLMLNKTDDAETFYARFVSQTR